MEGKKKWSLGIWNGVSVGSYWLYSVHTLNPRRGSRYKQALLLIAMHTPLPGVGTLFAMASSPSVSEGWAGLWQLLREQCSLPFRERDIEASNSLSIPVTLRLTKAEPAFCWGHCLWEWGGIPRGQQGNEVLKPGSGPGLEVRDLTGITLQGTKSGDENTAHVFTLGHLTKELCVELMEMNGLGMRCGKDSRKGPIKASRSHLWTHPWGEVAEITQWCWKQKISSED